VTAQTHDTHRYHAVDDVVSAELDGEVVLLNVVSGVYYGLNDIGTQIWQRLAAGATCSELADEFIEVYDVEPDRLRSDIEALMGRLLAAGLVRADERA